MIQKKGILRILASLAAFALMGNLRADGLRTVAINGSYRNRSGFAFDSRKAHLRRIKFARAHR